MNPLLRTSVIALLSTPLVASTLAAQTHDPVPVRVGVETYGNPGSLPLVPVPVIQFDLEDPSAPRIHLIGGWEGELAIVLFATAGAPEGDESIFVVSESVLPVFGVFGKQGFSIPFDPTLPALRGTTVYVQGFRLTDVASRPVLFASAGLKLCFVAGNAQPALQYRGPALTSLLSAENCGGPVLARLLTTVEAPSGGFELAHDRTDTQGGVTRIFLTLTAPNPSEIVTPQPERLRDFENLGDTAAPKIQILVRSVTRGIPSQPNHELAAEIQRDF